MLDRFLSALYRLTGSRRVSALMWRRACARRWQDRVAAHLDRGGAIVTVRSRNGETGYFAAGDDLRIDGLLERLA